MKKIIVIALMLGFAVSASAYFPSNSKVDHWSKEYTPSFSCTVNGWWKTTCVDISETSYYRNQMMGLAQQLIDNGFWLQFPQYSKYYRILGY